MGTTLCIILRRQMANGLRHGLIHSKCSMVTIQNTLRYADKFKEMHAFANRVIKNLEMILHWRRGINLWFSPLLCRKYFNTFANGFYTDLLPFIYSYFFCYNLYQYVLSNQE